MTDVAEPGTELVAADASGHDLVPADAEHPYGHTRAEAIAGSNVAVLVIVSALMVGWGTIRSFPLEPSHRAPPLWAPLWALLMFGVWQAQCIKDSTNASV